MALYRTGVEDIKAGYAMYRDCPFYAVFETANSNSTKTGRLIFSFKGEDREAGWEELQQALAALDATAPTIPHIIQFYEDLGKKDRIDSGTPYSGSFMFRMKPAAAYTPAINGVTTAVDQSFLNYLQTELRFAKEKIEELQDTIGEQEETIKDLEEKPVGKEIGGIIGTIGEAGNQFPWLQDVIKDGITFLKHTLKAPAHRNQEHERQGHSMAGIADDAPPDQRINHAIQTMVNWYGQEFGVPGTTDEDKKLAGFKKFADDMQLLAGLTADRDMMHMALKKLRATAA